MFSIKQGIFKSLNGQHKNIERRGSASLNLTVYLEWEEN